MSRTIITALEVVKYSPAGRDYPLTHICDRIAMVEEDIGYRVLGSEFYDYLLANLSAAPAAVEEWKDCNEYSVDELVQINGCVFVSLIDNNRADPLDSVDAWVEYPKFTVNCLNNFWTTHFRKYLAYNVYAGSLNYTTNATGAGGLVVRVQGDINRQNTTRTANKTEMYTMTASLLSDADMLYSNMLRWLIQNKTACKFGCILGVDAPAVKQHDRGGRRWAFRT